MPKYLLKFLKEEYLDDLLHKGLYMNAAGFFAEKKGNAKSNMWDKYECLASYPYQDPETIKNRQMEPLQEPLSEFEKLFVGMSVTPMNWYEGRNHPIWCCSMVEEWDIENGIFKFDKRVLTDFFEDVLKNARAVLIEFEKFVGLIKKQTDCGYDLRMGTIKYVDSLNPFFERYIPILRKTPELSYQRECRLVIYRECQANYQYIIRDNVKWCVLSEEKPYEPYFFRMENVESAIKCIYNVETLQVDEKYVYFQLP